MFSTVSLTAVLALASSADAFWRMPCRARTGLARIDPLVNPGTVAAHAHTIHGGGAFAETTTYDDLIGSQCTSCGVMEDKSAYWTPPLYFQYPNGTTEIVNQVGGMLAYYLLYGENITAFPPGFRLLAGDTRQRNFTWPIPDPPKSSWSGAQSSQFALGQKAIGFNCLNYQKNPEGSLYRHFFPDKDYLDANCVDGIRAELMFPSCWNGKDLDTTDHKSHMAYPSLTIDGTCPDGFNSRVPSLFYETIWDTYHYNGVPGQFVWGNGDLSGFGYHGDFINGWDHTLLQNAVDTCTNPSGEVGDCKLFTLQSDDDAAKCTFKQPTKLVTEDCAGPLQGLPGAVPIQYGPAYASALSPGNYNPSAAATTVAPSATTAVPVLTYKPGSIVVSNSNGGGGDITIANVKTADIVAAAAANPTVNAAAAAAPPSSQITPAPKPQETLPSGVQIVSTSYYTSNGIAYELVVEETEVTVTSTVSAYQNRKRHEHHLHHKHRRHAGFDF